MAVTCRTTDPPGEEPTTKSDLLSEEPTTKPDSPAVAIAVTLAIVFAAAVAILVTIIPVMLWRSSKRRSAQGWLYKRCIFVLATS